ncbi:MAG: hypothetical protein J3Q66DRAFT_102075 [Benniella sp.]|nr:MAG: hypothetical protein J3Q66DRAFT_102075 [Benniella sp.]
MTQSEDSTKDLVNPFMDNEPEQIMTVDQHESIAGSDTDLMTPTSLPSSFLSGVGTFEQRTLATLSTPQTDFNPQLVEGERTTAAAKRRIFAGFPQYDDDDCISTPTKIPGSGSRPTFSRSGSLLARLHDKGTMLGKHPQTHSPGEEGGSRTKGFKCLASSGDGRPESPSFSQTDTTGINGSFFSPIPPPNFGTPPGTPSRSPSFGLYVDSPDSPSASPFGDNPFLAPRQRARFEMDYLSESQWYSDYPHHLTVEYLDEVFNMEKRGRRLSTLASYEIRCSLAPFFFFFFPT